MTTNIRTIKKVANQFGYQMKVIGEDYKYLQLNNDLENSKEIMKLIEETPGSVVSLKTDIDGFRNSILISMFYEINVFQTVQIELPEDLHFSTIISQASMIIDQITSIGITYTSKVNEE